MTLQARARLAFLGVVVIWGATFAVVKAALADCAPLVFNLLRMVIATALLLAVNARALRQADRKTWRLGAAAGVLLGLSYQFQTAGLARTTPSKSAFLTGLLVVFVPLLSLLPGARPRGAARPHAGAIGGAVVAFAGLVLLTTTGGAGAALLGGMNRGDALTLGCAVLFAMHLLLLARSTPAMSSRALATVQVGVAALVMAATLPLGTPLYFQVSAAVAVGLGVTAVLASALALSVQTWVQKQISATETALLSTLEPVFAALVAMGFFGDRMNGRQAMGAALILGGIVLAEAWPARALLDAPD